MQLRNTALRAPRQLGRGRVGVCLLLCGKRLACCNLTSSELNSSTPAWRRRLPSSWWRTSGRPSARRRGSWRPLRRPWPAREMLWWQVDSVLFLTFGFCLGPTCTVGHQQGGQKNIAQLIPKIYCKPSAKLIWIQNWFWGVWLWWNASQNVFKIVLLKISLKGDAGSSEAVAGPTGEECWRLEG